MVVDRIDSAVMGRMIDDGRYCWLQVKYAFEGEGRMGVVVGSRPGWQI